MKKKGFTLIELLAVIVILAIIALIAVPMVLNIIEKSKIGALKSSLNGLIESADMYYANNQLTGGNAVETIFDFEDGEQISGATLEYKGKIENGKLILHTNGEVAACIDDGEHYAYKNKNDNEVTTGTGTCLYDGTTGNFSSNSLITDLRGQVVEATNITSDDTYTYINIPEEGHYDATSQLKVENSNLGNKYVGNFSLGNHLYNAYNFPNGEFTVTSSANTAFTIKCVTAGTYKLILSAKENGSSSFTVTVKKGSTTQENFTISSALGNVNKEYTLSFSANETFTVSVPSSSNSIMYSLVVLKV